MLQPRPGRRGTHFFSQGVTYFLVVVLRLDSVLALGKCQNFELKHRRWVSGWSTILLALFHFLAAESEYETP
jgi:hypothetical protein